MGVRGRFWGARGAKGSKRGRGEKDESVVSRGGWKREGDVISSLFIGVRRGLGEERGKVPRKRFFAILTFWG